MITTGFGRRAPTPQRPGLVLIPDGAAEFPAPAVDLASLSELKERIRTVLLSRIDPTVAGRIPRAALRREVAKLVNEIATEDRVQLNKLEEMALAAKQLGWEYFGVADHSQSLTIARGLPPGTVRKQWAEIDRNVKAMAIGPLLPYADQNAARRTTRPRW